MIAVNDGTYRFVFRPEGRGAQRAELYDISSDKYESRNIIRQEPEVRARMTKIAEEYLASTPPEWGAAPEVELDPAQLEQLRALGYQVE